MALTAANSARAPTSLRIEGSATLTRLLVLIGDGHWRPPRRMSAAAGRQKNNTQDRDRSFPRPSPDRGPTADSTSSREGARKAFLYTRAANGTFHPKDCAGTFSIERDVGVDPD